MEDPTESDADAKVAAYVLKAYRHSGYNTHLVSCPDIKVEYPEMFNGAYGCDTGCEYAQLTATLSCPHGERDPHFEYGTFGEISSLIEELDAL